MCCNYGEGESEMLRPLLNHVFCTYLQLSWFFFLRLQGSYSLYAGDVEDGILLAKGGEFMISESVLITPPTASS